MKWYKIAGVVFGAFIAFLGLLWFLQGTGILQVKPVACVANCEEIVGASPLWAAAGAIAIVVGSLVVVACLRRSENPETTSR